MVMQLQALPAYCGCLKPCIYSHAKPGLSFCMWPRRPTFFPGSKLRHLDRAAALQDPRVRMLCGLANALADLAHPKAALGLLRDMPRLSAYRLAIHAALSGQPGAVHFAN